MYTHPELGLRLAQGKIDEARSWARRASALRSARLDGQALGVAAGGRRNAWPAPVPASLGRSRARRRSLGARAPWTTKG
jgi:hypothetical protein